MTSHRVHLGAALAAMAVGVLVACPLPSNVRYRCESNGTCAQDGYRCAADGFCYAGECTPRDTTAECAQVECGLVSDGCGGSADCGKWCPEGLECGVAAPNLCGMPRVCTAAGWCWENPLPQGATLHAAFRADERHTWFVGEMGTVLLFDGEKSSLEALPLDAPATFHGIHGASRTDLYVVGTDGLIFHFDGAAWTKEGISTAIPTTLRAVLALPDGKAVAVGEGGRALYREPTAPVDRRWREATTDIMVALVDVVALPDGGVLALSENGRLLSMRQDMLTWTTLPGPPAPFQYNQGLGLGAHAAAVRNGHLYVGGTPGGSAQVSLARLEDDGGWRSASDAGREVFDVFVAGEDLWVVGRSLVQVLGADDVASPIVGQPPGTPQNGSASLPWRAGVPLRPGEALVAGTDGVMAVARPDAGQLLMRSQGSLRDVNAVCGFGVGAMYGASTVENPQSGCTGGGNCRPRVLERIEASAGAYWRSRDTMELGGTVELLGCYAYGPDRVWLMGNDSKFFYQSGATWEYGDFGFTGITGAYIAGWGLPDAGYTFLRAGESTLNVSPDGLDNWQEVSLSGPSTELHGVWGVGGEDRVLVGEAGAVRRWAGGQWQSPLTTGFTERLLTVHGALLRGGGQRYVAAGEGGRVFALETGDTPWTAVLPGGPRVMGAWVSSSGTAWVAGYVDQTTPSAYVARQAGPQATFEPVPLHANRELRSVFGIDLPDGGSVVWIAGEEGMIFRHDGP
ncbi:MAG: hypothetical protein AB1938_24245 [Myxococcota bacterium]